MPVVYSAELIYGPFWAKQLAPYTSPGPKIPYFSLAGLLSILKMVFHFLVDIKTSQGQQIQVIGTFFYQSIVCT